MEVILTHEHADFDAIAAQAGLARLVPGAVAVLPQEINANVQDFLRLYGRELPLRHRDQLPRGHVTRAWVVDTRSAHLVPGMTLDTPHSVIDHHVGADHRRGAEDTADVQPVGATTTLIVERLADAGIALSPVEATLFLLGIHEDTGSLTYSGTTTRDAAAAAWLMARGADLEVLVRFLRHPISDAAQALSRTLLDNARILTREGREIVVTHASAPHCDEELATLATKLVDILGPDAVVVLVDVGSHVQLIGRSTTDLVDVSTVARAFGGGGHPRAAAAVVRDLPVAEVLERVVADLPAAIRPGPRVGDIMTRGRVRTLAAEQSVGDALQIARQFGHEGYPVVAGERLLGVVTRRELDLAAHHNLAAVPVARLLGPGPIAVAPQDTVDTLQHLMTENDLGQVPVLEDGRMVGIVTRTDLLKLWAKRAARRGEPPVRLDLSAALPGAWFRTVRQVAEVAESQAAQAYLVGGLVRDLLLGRTHGPDIDLVVVEGSAPDLAQAVAARYGGEVQVHTAFGTATWRRDGLTIDLTTARAEFYKSPTALPSVEPGSLRSDLRRRDFSVNALAVNLDADQFGAVIDLFGGLSDLRQRRIRVLHRLSFVEDPTRILRAIRLAVRLGFRLEADTAGRIPDALPLVGQVSGARLVGELRQAMNEPVPAAVLAAMNDHGVLNAITTGLGASDRLPQLLRDLPEAWIAFRGTAAGRSLPVTPDWRMQLLTWLADNGRAGLGAAERLRLPRRQRDLLASALALTDPECPLSGPPLPNSQLYRLLDGIRAEALVLAAVVARAPGARKDLRRFAAELAGIANPLAGADLAALGIPPGPIYRTVLDTVHDAVLDGQVTGREEALALATRLIADHEPPPP